VLAIPGAPQLCDHRFGSHLGHKIGANHFLSQRPPSFQIVGDRLVQANLRLGSELLGDQREAVFGSRLSQLPVPAGELDLFAGSEGQSAGKVDSVVCAQSMNARALRCPTEQGAIDFVNVDSTPEVPEILEPSA
jgi:hypothetical protein